MQDFFDGLENGIAIAVTAFLFLVPVILAVWMVLAWNT